ncbi:unnamed protein product [Sphagnum jensenii]|jgi:hypothetical protein|uniref:Uncharacterized protein n=1 Tax=Sphagnum jensenii TaxID=128206 RepID=A0ABP0WAN6_9BRYO
MKEQAKWAAAVVKKQLQSCCPYGRLTDHKELVDLEQGLEDTDPNVFDHGHLHHHAACLQNIVAMVASKSAVRPMLKIIQGKPINSKPKVVQSATCKLYTFSPWSMVKPFKAPELQISSPLQAQFCRPAQALELQTPQSSPTQAIRLESSTLVDSATTLSIDFSPRSNYSSQVHAQSDSGLGSPTQVQQHPSARHVYVPHSPLLHPSLEIVSSEGLESSGVTFPLSYCSQELESKVSRHVSVGYELPGISAAVPVPVSSPSTIDHGSKFSHQKIAGATSVQLHAPGSTSAAVSPGPVSNGSPLSDCQLCPETVARIPAQSLHAEDLKIQAAVKIQTTIRGCQSGCNNSKHNVAGTPESSQCDEDPVRILSQELEEVHSITTRMSRTEAQPRVKKLQQQRQPASPAVAAVAAHKVWNASIHTAEDCKLILQRKQEAAMKRERALQYALSHQRWKKSSKFQVPQWSPDDAGILDKPGWIWSWLERAARMGAHGSQNCVFDNDSNSRDPQSESLSVKSTVGVCTAEPGSCSKSKYNLQEQIQVGWSTPDQWPLSLRQQHAAGLLVAHAATPQEDTQGKLSCLLKSKCAGAAEPPVSTAILTAGTRLIREDIIHYRHCLTNKTDTVEEPDLLEKGFSSTSTEDNDDDDDEDQDQTCVSPQSNRVTSRTGHAVARKLKFGASSLQQNLHESVGSCVLGEEAPLKTSVKCRQTSHFAGDERLQFQYGSGLTDCMSNHKMVAFANSADESEIQQVQHGHLDVQSSCAVLEDGDGSVATTAAFIQRPFWRV